MSTLPRLSPFAFTLTVHENEATRIWTPPNAPMRCIGLQDAALGTQWRQVEPERRLYDWRTLDQFARCCVANGLTMLGTLRGVPGWCATSTVNDGYNQAGAMSMPDDLDAVQEFTHEWVWRYNRPSPINPQGLMLMPYLKLGNEPPWDFEPTLEGNGTPDWGARVRLDAAAYFGAKTANPRTICTCAAMPAGHIESLLPYLQASDGRGGQGIDHIDAIAINAYGMDFWKLHALLTRVQQIATELGRPNIEICITEAGHQSKHAPAFLTLPESRQGPEWANCILLATTLGVRLWHTYSWNPAQDTPAQRLELYGMEAHPGWAASLSMLAPFIGHRVQHLAALDGDTLGGRHLWRLGSRKVVI